MNGLLWYIARLSSMSFTEIGFRVKQNISYKKQFFLRKKTIEESKKATLIKKPQKIFDYSKLDIFFKEEYFAIFGEKINIYDKINWHKDISSNNEFPLFNSKKIDTRSSTNGDAKYVWEVNRLTFLLIFVLNYNSTKDKKYLRIFEKQLSSWIESNPYLIGVNWYSNIEVNLRLIIWFFCWEILDVNKIISKDKEFSKFVEKKWLPIIYLHCRYSYENPSKYSSANNHLISEYSGLFIASNYWQFDESSKWKEYSVLGLEKEIIKQHSKNGINKEQAAEYIQFIADFFIIPLIIIEKQKNSVFSDIYKEFSKKIIDYIYYFTDAQCSFPKYGDEDDGVILKVDFPHFNNFKSLLLTGYKLFGDKKYLSKIDIIDNKNRLLFQEQKFDLSIKKEKIFDSKFFKEEGHFIYKNKVFNDKEFYFYFKASDLGYLSTAAHGHADALSFIIHYNGQPIFIDSGTYTYYGNEEYRKYFKGTLAHNTVRIDGKDQAQYSGSMLWSNHYTCKIKESKFDDNGFSIIASHSGYDKYGCLHQRGITFDKNLMEIVILDFIKTNDNLGHLIELPFHFYPTLNYLKRNNSEQQILINNEIKISIQNFNDMNLVCYNGSENPICGWYSENYGKIAATNTLVYQKTIKKDIEIKTVIKLEQT